MYKQVIRPILFRFSAEWVHRATVWALRVAGRTPVVRAIMRRSFTLADPRLEREVLGMRFPNPIGMAAGFDKDATAFRELALCGFGFVEVGTVTPLPQPGNPRPRLFRLPRDRALVNRMGFNNKGMRNAIENLRGRAERPIVGINIGKNTLTPAEDAAGDYLKLFRAMYEFGDYFTINVSCPNVAGLTSMQSRESLAEIVDPLLDFRRGQDRYKPVLVKISPDLTDGELDAVIAVVVETSLDGVVATNTTSAREGRSVGGGLHISRKKLDAIGRGGLSGAPLMRRAVEVVRYVHEHTGGAYPIIASGGVMTPADVREMLDAGADLVQIYTGLVYNGPGFVKDICKELLNDRERAADED